MGDLTRKGFDYERYLTDVKGITVDREITQQEKDNIYTNFVRDSFSRELGKTTKDKKNDVISATLDKFGEDARVPLGIPTQQTDSDTALFNSFDGVIRKSKEINDLNGDLSTATLGELIDEQVKTIASDSGYFQFPQLRKEEGVSANQHKRNLKNNIVKQAGDFDDETREEFLQQTFGGYLSNIEDVKQEEVSRVESIEKEKTRRVEDPTPLETIVDFFKSDDNVRSTKDDATKPDDKTIFDGELTKPQVASLETATNLINATPFVDPKDFSRETLLEIGNFGNTVTSSLFRFGANVIDLPASAAQSMINTGVTDTQKALFVSTRIKQKQQKQIQKYLDESKDDTEKKRLTTAFEKFNLTEQEQNFVEGLDQPEQESFIRGTFDGLVFSEETIKPYRAILQADIQKSQERIDTTKSKKLSTEIKEDIEDFKKRSKEVGSLYEKGEYLEGFKKSLGNKVEIVGNFISTGANNPSAIARTIVDSIPEMVGFQKAVVLTSVSLFNAGYSKSVEEIKKQNDGEITEKQELVAGLSNLVKVWLMKGGSDAVVGKVLGKKITTEAIQKTLPVPVVNALTNISKIKGVPLVTLTAGVLGRTSLGAGGEFVSETGEGLLEQFSVVQDVDKLDFDKAFEGGVIGGLAGGTTSAGLSLFTTKPDKNETVIKTDDVRFTGTVDIAHIPTDVDFAEVVGITRDKEGNVENITLDLSVPGTTTKVDDIVEIDSSAGSFDSIAGQIPKGFDPVTPEPSTEQTVDPVTPKPSTEQTVDPVTPKPSTEQTVDPVTPEPSAEQTVDPVQHGTKKNNTPFKTEKGAKNQIKRIAKDNGVAEEQLNVKEVGEKQFVVEQAPPVVNNEEQLNDLDDPDSVAVAEQQKDKPEVVEDTIVEEEILKPEDFVVEEIHEPLLISVTQDNNTKKITFNKEETIEQLKEAGFDNVVVNQVTLSAHRDGIIYRQIIQKKNNNNDYVVKSSIDDIDRQIHKKTLPSQELAQSGELTTTTIDLTPQNRGIKLIPDPTGDALLDASSVDNLVSVLGGVVQKHDGTNITFSHGDDVFVIERNPEGDFIVVRNDGENVTTQGVVTQGGSINILPTDNKFSATLATRKLIDKGYTVKKVSTNPAVTTVKLEKEGAEDITLVKKKQGKVTIKKSLKSKKVSSIEELNSITDETIVENTGVDYSEVRAQERKADMDTTEIVENDGIFVSEEGSLNVEFVPEADHETVDSVATSFLASTGTTNTEQQEALEQGFPQQAGEWTTTQLEEILDVIPPHLRKMIVLSNAPLKNSNGYVTNGYFSYSSKNGPQIVVDARPTTRSLQQVLTTLNHELSHFTTESWLTLGMTDVVDTAYDILKDKFSDEIPQYIKAHGNKPGTPIDLDNATPSQKRLLVHEYMAKLNTSLVDLDGVTNFGSLDTKTINDLKKEVANKVNKVTLDLTKDIVGDKEASKAFLKDIIRLQTGVLNSNAVELTVKSDKGVVQVRTTPRGRRVSYLNNNNTEQVKNERTLYLATKAKTGDKAAGMALFFDRHIRTLTGRQFLGDEVVRIFDGGLNTFVKEFVKGIRILDSDRLAVNLVLQQKGVQPDKSVEVLKSLDKLYSFADSTQKKDDIIEAEIAIRPVFNTSLETTSVAALEKAGVKKGKKIYEKAKRRDDFHNGLKREQNNNVAEIRQASRRQERVAIAMVNKLKEQGREGSSINTLQKLVADMRGFASKFETDYTHRQYKMHTQEGEADLRAILADFALDKKDVVSLADQSAKARIKIKKVQKKRTEGKLSEQQAIKKINKLVKPLELQHQQELLLMWVHRTIRNNGQDTEQKDLPRQMAIKVIDGLLEKNKYERNRTSVDRINNIDGVRERTLDPEVGLDRLMMRFLQPITDPTQLAIGTLQQQKKVLFNLTSSTEKAEILFNTGLGLPIGSTKPQTWIGDTSLFKGQKGTILSFMEVPVFVADELKDMASIHDSENSFFKATVGVTKQNTTRNNPALLIGNYTGNIALFGPNGSWAYMTQYAPRVDENGKRVSGEATEATKVLFSERLYGVTGKGKKNTIYKELNDNYLLQGGATNLDVAVNSPDLLEKMVSLVTEMSQMDQTRRGLWIQKVKRFNDILSEAYVLGDDYSKILPYMVNREIMVAKVKGEMDRTSYPDGKFGDDKYEADILKLAIPQAIQKTSKETFVWTQMPTWIKKLSASRTNPIIGSYVAHPTQWLRIFSNFHVNPVVDLTEVVRVGGWNGNGTEYSRLLRKKAVASLVGTAFMDLSLVAGTTGVGAGLSSLGSLIVNGVSALLGLGEDEENGKNFNTEGAFRLGNIPTFQGTQPFIPIAGTLDPDDLSYWTSDLDRMNVTHTFKLSEQTTNDPSVVKSADAFIGKFLGNTEGGNLARRYLNLMLDKPLRNQGFINNTKKQYMTQTERAAEIVKLTGILPTYVSQTIESLVAGKEFTESKVFNSLESNISDAENIRKILKLFGIRVRKVYPKRQLNSIGYMLANDMRETELLGGYMRSIKGRSVISETRAKSIANDLTKLTKDKTEKYTYYVEGVQLFRDSLKTNKLRAQLSNSNIVSSLTKSVRNGTRIPSGKKTSQQLLSQIERVSKGLLVGKNIFLEDMRKDVTKKIEKLVAEIEMTKDKQGNDKRRNTVESLKKIRNRL